MSSQIATLSNCLGCILDSSNNPRDKIRVQPINAIWWGAFCRIGGYSFLSYYKDEMNREKSWN